MRLVKLRGGVSTVCGGRQGGNNVLRVHEQALEAGDGVRADDGMNGGKVGALVLGRTAQLVDGETMDTGVLCYQSVYARA